MFYLIHKTNRIENILRDGYLKSGKVIIDELNDKENFGDYEYGDYEYLEYIFTTLVKEEDIKKYVQLWGYDGNSLLFNPSLLLTRSFTLNFFWKGRPDGITYDGKNLNEKELMDILKHYYKQNKKNVNYYKSDLSNVYGEILFENQINVKKYLLKIYIYDLYDYYSNNDDKIYNMKKRKLIKIVDIVRKNYENVDVVLFTPIEFNKQVENVASNRKILKDRDYFLREMSLLKNL